MSQTIITQVLCVSRFSGVIQIVPKTGVYKDRSVAVAHILDSESNVVAVIGLVDVYGTLNLMECLC